MPRVPRLPRPRGSLLLAIAVAMLAFPLGVLASHQFGDVPDSNPFHADIDAVADAGVTTGCGGGNYCPSANVTREQMAAFMNRLGALGPGKTPVVNARTSQSTDGWSIGCPTNTVLSGGLCFETATRGSGSVFTATETCANVGGGLFGRGQIWRLPMALELRAARNNGDITMTATEWSQSFYYDDVNGAQAAAVTSTGGTEDHNTLDVLAYRCAAIPLQIDNLIFIPLSEEQDGTDAGEETTTAPVTEDGAPAN